MNNNYFLFLDDERIPSDVFWRALPVPQEDQEWVIVRSPQAFMDHIQTHGLPLFVTFDHDLQDQSEIEVKGVQCAQWLVDYCLDNNMRLPAFEVHSKNGEGEKNIRSLLENFKQHQNRYRPKI